MTPTPRVKISLGWNTKEGGIMKFLRKMIMGVSALAFTAVALTTATFAWFEIYSEVKVQGLNITATSGLGFMISVDGVNYKNDLTKNEIYSAMLCSYAPDDYKFKYNEDTKESTLYKMRYNDETGEYEYNQALSNDSILNAIKEIELTPLTSRNGVDLTSFDNASAEKGKYIEFKVYFKTTGTRGEYEEATEIVANKRYYKRTGEYYVNVNQLGITLTESNVSQYYYKINDADPSEEYKTGLAVYDPNNQTKGYTFYKRFYNVVDVTEKAQSLVTAGDTVYELKNGYMYEIYLNGEQQTSDSNGATISPTRFISNIEDIVPISLGADMDAVLNGQVVHLNGPTDLNPIGDSITVYGANALRMSITDENALFASGGTRGSLIYELNDYKYGDKNFGSYATTYSEAYCTAHGLTLDPELKLLYGYECNAMYTYYTHLKQSTALYDSLMDIDEIPTTIKDLTSKGADGEYLYNKKITTLSSGEDGKLITFRIWLEGWDADCFDGIKGSIQSQLSFSSKRIK